MLPKVSNKELVVLGLLASRGDMFGLQMVKESNKAIGRGTIYVTLARMEKKGLVESFRKDAGNSIEDYKKHYKITGMGQRTLRDMENALAAWKGGAAHATP